MKQKLRKYQFEIETKFNSLRVSDNLKKNVAFKLYLEKNYNISVIFGKILIN